MLLLWMLGTRPSSKRSSKEEQSKRLQYPAEPGLQQRYKAHVRCRADKGIRNIKSYWGRNKRHLAPYAWRSLRYGLFRQNPGYSCRYEDCLCYECLACKYKDSAFPDNAQDTYNCHALRLIDRYSLRALPCVHGLENESYGGFEVRIK